MWTSTLTCLAGALISTKVRNATAWGNAPGNLPTNPEALKARHETVLPLLQYFFRAFSALEHHSTVNLGRWPRLLHHAPLALNASNLVDESSMTLFSQRNREMALQRLVASATGSSI